MLNVPLSINSVCMESSGVHHTIHTNLLPRAIWAAAVVAAPPCSALILLRNCMLSIYFFAIHSLYYNGHIDGHVYDLLTTSKQIEQQFHRQIQYDAICNATYLLANHLYGNNIKDAYRQFSKKKTIYIYIYIFLVYIYKIDTIYWIHINNWMIVFIGILKTNKNFHK